MLREAESQLTDRRLFRAREHVCRNWFPANPEILNRIKNNLRSDYYLQSPHELIEDITSDFALFMYCLREVSALLRKEGQSRPLRKTPHEFLQAAGLPRLQKILTVESPKISSHAFNAVRDFQATELEKSLLSASSSSVLSEQIGLDSNLAYSTALLRHLGYALIAWNYASVYQKALTSMQPTESLDAFLTQALGFSPVSLAIAVVSGWGLSQDVETAIAEPIKVSGVELRENEIENDATKLIRICKISETLARANFPKEHPHAVSEWGEAKKEIVAILGPGALSEIQRKFIHVAAAYGSVLPHVKSEAFSIDPERRIIERKYRMLSQPNEFVMRCPESLRESLISLYRSIPSQDAASLVRLLIQQIVPRNQFPRGCVYTIDLDLGWLVPQLKFGDLKPMTVPFFKTPSEEETDPISKAFYSNELIMGSLNNTEKPKCYFAKSIGGTDSVGVIYLESDCLLNEVISSTLRDEFNAIAVTLSDCLSLV